MSVKLTTIMALCGLVVTGCATSGVSVTNEGAPITYKMGQGGAQYASLSYGKSTARPKFGTPSRLSEAPRPTQINPIGGQGVQFDPSKVDTQLYGHQKVGRRYTIMGKSYTPRHEPYYDQVGTSSWYGPKFHGKPTATGEIFNMRDMTAAHQTLPLNSMLYVTNLDNGQSVMVRLNDRGPFIGDRILDLSEAAAEALSFRQSGTANVRVVYAGPADPMAAGRSIPKLAPRPAPMPQDNIAERQAPLSLNSTPSSPAPYQPMPYQPAPALPAPYEPAPAQPAPRPRAPQATPPRRPVAQAPARPAPRAPQAVPGHGSGHAGPNEGENVTLTIKGPIHIARTDEHTEEPVFIIGRTYAAQPDW